jgi:hypothetical protein
VVYAAIIRRDIVGVEKDAFLYYPSMSIDFDVFWKYIHLLKLVTGVDTSTRPDSRSGRVGKTVDSSNRTAAAAPKRSSSSDMVRSKIIEALAP